MTKRRRIFGFTSWVVSMTALTFSLFTLGDEIFPDSPTGWVGNLGTAMMLACVTAWYHFRDKEAAGSRIGRLVVTLLAIATWLAIGFRASYMDPPANGTISTGLVCLVALFGPDLAKKAWHRLRARGQ